MNKVNRKIIKKKKNYEIIINSFIQDIKSTVQPNCFAFTISNLSNLRGKISCTSVSISHDAKEAVARVTTTLLHVDAETRGTR